MSGNHKKLVKLSATYSLSCDGYVPVKVVDWNFFIDSVNELTEENARLREDLKNIEGISTSTPDKQHNDITISDVSLMDNALQRIFEIAYKIRLKGDEDE